MKVIRVAIVGVAVFLAIGWLSSCSRCEKDCEGVPEKGTICTKEYNPVCGCDGNTYGNPCEAKAAGIKRTTPGPCNQKRNDSTATIK